MSEQYRASALRCPFCGGLMEERTTDAAAVDICTDCRGVWIDWFDGEICAVARAIDVRPERPAVRAAERSCPRCAGQLVAEPFRESGPSILRCPGCAGVGVPAGSLAEIVALGPPPEVQPRHEEPGLWDRLVQTLRRILPGSSL